MLIFPPGLDIEVCSAGIPIGLEVDINTESVDRVIGVFILLPLLDLDNRTAYS